ncbi:MAG: ROK family protein, partial [Bacteroidota bacterium]|nr:ROK family protein [Bacteroidota bacterium]
MMIDLANELAIGIDIGGTNTKYGLVNHRGEILDKGDIRTDEHENPESFIDALYNVLAPIIQKHSSDHSAVKGIGIGAPNGNYYTGTIDYAPNLAWRGIVPLAKMVTQKFSLPAALTNDANAAAVGEMNYGAARGMRDFIMITLG